MKHLPVQDKEAVHAEIYHGHKKSPSFNATGRKETMKHLLIISGRLDNLNDYIGAERSNRYKGAAMKTDNERIVSIFIRKCLKDIKIRNPVIMHYRWYERNSRRDLDNISSFGRKVIQDALVKE